MVTQGCSVRFKEVSKIYIMGNEQVHALNRVNLSVEPGEFITIVGASGSGKSTLLHLAAGLDKPSEGKISLDNKPVSDWKDNELTVFRKEKIGIIFQFFNLLPTLTAEENAALPLLMMRKPKSFWKPEVDKWMDRVGLSGRKKHYPSELSGGQMQRVAIIRALITQPMLILADEPTGNLDSKTGEEILDFIKNISEETNTTIMLITHDSKVAAYGSRVVTMKDGQILDIAGR
ncbi:MAG: ABC transporter ATP-binding protein [Ruminiclostridium sp.]|nr:ABC transporter ATP-binding protein [Ruminiclostridium sp.]